MKIHPHDLLLQELFSPLDDRDEVLDHVIGCPDCQERVKTLLRTRPGQLAEKVARLERWLHDPVEHDRVLDRSALRIRSFTALYERERSGAFELLSELLEHPAERRQIMVRNNPRFHTWGLFDLLLKRSSEQNFEDAIQAESLARLALEIPEHLDASSHGIERVEDMRARAWAYLGNALRVKADLREAEDAFQRAFTHLQQGTREPMERAVLLDLRASLLRAQRRFGEALQLLRRAIAIFRKLGERHRAGRAFVSMSTVQHMAGEPERAIPLLYEALDLIDPAREPQLMLFAWHNLVDDLAEAGQFLEAHKLLLRARPLYQQFQNAWTQNRLRWVEGRIARGLGQTGQAEALLLAARTGFLAEDAAYDTALVSLDLASLYAEQRRLPELKRLAEEMVPIFSSRQIHREALAALAFWKQAVEAETAGLDLVASVAAFLKRAQYNTTLRFEEPA
jgi:tetratricopeptide (TPR) repeat protein